MSSGMQDMYLSLEVWRIRAQDAQTDYENAVTDYGFDSGEAMAAEFRLRAALLDLRAAEYPCGAMHQPVGERLRAHRSLMPEGMEQ